MSIVYTKLKLNDGERWSFVDEEKSLYIRMHVHTYWE